ncbi:MAG: 4Fe-4S ferredoxin [Fusobacteriota bacterium]
MFAVRNGSLCTKDCVCLYVCPTGATATEDGSIDKSKCLDGCRLCVDACPSNAIYLLPEKLPVTKKLTDDISEGLYNITKKYGDIYFDLVKTIEKEENKNRRRLMKALAHSTKILSEDGIRGAGYLKPEVEIFEQLLKKNENNENFKKVIELLK